MYFEEEDDYIEEEDFDINDFEEVSYYIDKKNKQENELYKLLTLADESIMSMGPVLSYYYKLWLVNKYKFNDIDDVIKNPFDDVPIYNYYDLHIDYRNDRDEILKKNNKKS